MSVWRILQDLSLSEDEGSILCTQVIDILESTYIFLVELSFSDDEVFPTEAFPLDVGVS